VMGTEVIDDAFVETTPSTALIGHLTGNSDVVAAIPRGV
jgi:hypothetical protein